MKPTGKIFWFGLASALASGTLIRRIRSTRDWLASRARSGRGVALITGASSGIGAEFARRLALDGYDLVLVARRADRLQAVADEIKVEASRRSRSTGVEVLPADLDSAEGIAQVERRIQSLPKLEVLVNNAGFGTGGAYAAADLSPELSMVQVHIQATMRLTRAALPVLIARGHGAVINVSSMAAFIPLPGNITYGASKAFLNSFTEGLRDELRGTGVRAQALCPGLTTSEFHDRLEDVHNGFRSRFPSFLWLPTWQVVEESLQGMREDRAVVVPGILYKLGYYLLKIIPLDLARKAGAFISLWMRRH